METLPFEDFKKVELRVGKIISAERVEGSDKLLKLEVDFGDHLRTVVSGIGKQYKPEDIIGKECPFAYNLEPRTLKGIESQGMMLCANDNGPVLLHPDKPIPPGSAIT